MDEHTKDKDRDVEFVVPNYRTATTSQTEYWFVADPSDEKLRECGMEAWPTEQRDHDLRKHGSNPIPPPLKFSSAKNPAS